MSHDSLDVALKNWYNLKIDVLQYIDKNYLDPKKLIAADSYIRYSRKICLEEEPEDKYNPSKLDPLIMRLRASTNPGELLKEFESNRDATFAEKLFFYIIRGSRKNNEIYQSVGMDRRLFSKIVSDSHYRPSKDTVIAFCFALKLSGDESADLLRRAGYTLSHSDKRDLVIEYFLRQEIYNFSELNEMLSELGLKIVGREL